MEVGVMAKKLSDARIRANNQYNAKAYDRINIAVPKGDKDKIRKHIERTGDPSINAFVSRAISETLDRDLKNK